MKPTQEKTDSLKKALDRSETFDEANYYKSKTVEMGGDDVMEETEEKPEEEEDDDDHHEDHEFYGDD